MIRLIPALLLACCLSACAVPGSHYILAPRTFYPPVAYVNWTETAPPEELRMEMMRLEAVLSRETNLKATVQYAILLSATGENDANSERIIALLRAELNRSQEVLSKQDEEYKTFARILLSEQELRELSRQFNAARADREEELQRINTLQAEVEELKAKIRAITNIEQELSERELDTDDL